jgi:hypothetical protein
MEKEYSTKQRYLFCDCAESDTGKTTFLLDVIGCLINTFGYTIHLETDLRDINKRITYAGDGNDRWVVLEKDGKKIIVQTEGDYQTSFNNTYNYTSKYGEVDIIICASRLDTKIKERAKLSKYKVHFFQHIISCENSHPFVKQQDFAEKFCDIIDSL